MGKILVTGGAGYIGSHIVRQLSELGEQVVVLDSLLHGEKNSLLHNEELIVGDIRNITDLENAFSQYSFDTVIHMAALVDAAESHEKKEEYWEVNAKGSQNVWETAQKHGVKHFLYASSAAVYGTPQSQTAVKEEGPLSTESPYGESKLEGEISLEKTVGNQGNYLAFRFFNVGGAEEKGRLGQNSESRAIMQQAFKAAAGLIPEIIINGRDFGSVDGTAIRDFVHVEDIAFAFVLGLSYLRKGGESRILNLGSGVDHTVGEVLKEVEVVSGKKLNIKYGSRIKGDIAYSLADIRQAKAVLGWEPVHTLRLIISDGWNSYVQRKK